MKIKDVIFAETWPNAAGLAVGRGIKDFASGFGRGLLGLQKQPKLSNPNRKDINAALAGMPEDMAALPSDPNTVIPLSPTAARHPLWANLSQAEKNNAVAAAAKDGYNVDSSGQHFEPPSLTPALSSPASSSPAPTPAPASPSTPAGGAVAPASTPATTPPRPRSSTPPPQITAPSGEIITKYGNKWYDEDGAEIVNAKDIAELERRWKSKSQTTRMAPGRSAAKTSALTPAAKGKSMVPSYSKPPQRKQGRKR